MSDEARTATEVKKERKEPAAPERGQVWASPVRLIGIVLIVYLFLFSILMVYGFVQFWVPPVVFLAANVLILLVILALNRRVGAKPSQADGLEPESPGQELLEASDILGREFEYARITASEAMRDRHTMVNFYLLVAGVVASGVVAVMEKMFNSRKLPEPCSCGCCAVSGGSIS